MPSVRSHARLQSDPRALASLMYGCPLAGIEYRRHSLFWTGFFSPEETHMLRQLWRQNRESITARFQELHPGLLPFAHWKFSTSQKRDDAPYAAEMNRINNEWWSNRRKTKSPASTSQAE